LGDIKFLLVERLKIFVDTKKDAFNHAIENADQYLMDRITAWRGNPAVRTKMNFEVFFNGIYIVWKPWD
jgi:hypothetical protein